MPVHAQITTGVTFLTLLGTCTAHAGSRGVPADCTAIEAASLSASLALGDRTFVGLGTRPPIAKLSNAQLVAPPGEHRLIVKFIDGARVRTDAAGQLRSLTGADLTALDEALTRASSEGVAVAGARAAAPISFRPLIMLADDAFDQVESRAAARTGMMPADMRGMMIVDAPTQDLERIAAALNDLEAVEWVQFERIGLEPPCADIGSMTPVLVSSQSYRPPNPGTGIGGVQATTPGTLGAGIAIADIEYGFDLGHEELCGVSREPGQSIAFGVFPASFFTHGTAVLGILGAPDNGFGITGMAPEADLWFFPEWSIESGSRRAAAITSAAATLDMGDIIVLEMQNIVFGNDFGPAELQLSVWTASKLAVDAGMVVIGAAGNGNQNLDSAAYVPYQQRGDSGAIIVGAGSPDLAHNKLGFSTFGSRVNVQGWGQGVAATGYGDLANIDNDLNQRYTRAFNGTSSATPIVAGVAAGVQSYLKSQHGVVLDALSMRELLIDTGIPQGSGGNIGPFPDAAAAVANATRYAGPKPFALISPDDNDEVFPITFAWAPSRQATGYELVISETPSLDTPVFSGKAADAFLTLGSESAPLIPGVQYYWSVTASNAIDSTGPLDDAVFFFVLDGVPCPGDSTGDGVVDTADLLELLANFNQAVINGPAGGDFDSSGVVDTADLLALLAAFNQSCS